MCFEDKLKVTVAIAFLVFLIQAVPAEAQQKQIRMPVSYMGSGSDSDRETAKGQARDNAEANLFCAGRLENVRSSAQCTKVGGGESAQWMCIAVVTGTCAI
jgi:hypothetical protein